MEVLYSLMRVLAPLLKEHLFYSADNTLPVQHSSLGFGLSVYKAKQIVNDTTHPQFISLLLNSLLKEFQVCMKAIVRYGQNTN